MKVQGDGWMIRTKFMRAFYQHRAASAGILGAVVVILLGIGALVLDISHPAARTSSWLAPTVWVVAFLLVVSAYSAFRKLHERLTHRIGWWLFNAGCVWFGAFIARNPKTTHFGEVEIPVLLAVPFYIILCLAMGKILVSIVSLPLIQGLLPDSLKTYDVGLQKQEQLLHDAWRSEARFAQALIEVHREESRHVLRQFRIQYPNDEDFVYHALMSMVGALYYKFEDHSDMYFTSVEDVFDPVYDQLEPRAYALTLKAADGEDGLYWADLEQGACAIAYRLEALGHAYIVTSFFRDRIISPSEYEHFWQVCLAMFEDQTIVQRELAIAYHAYLQGVLS
jgi:hypothetical protein